MCYARSSAALSRLSILWGLAALATLLTAFVSNVWLFTWEPVRLPNSDQSTTITFKIGLWRVCPTVKRGNITQHLPSPACSLIKYSTWDEVKHSDLGVWTTLDFTPAFISRMRLSTPFEAVSVFLMLLATMFAVIGHCNGDHKTLVACGLFILGGLSLGGGLVIFASVLSDAFMDRPRRHQPSLAASTLYSGYNAGGGAFDYRYGWSFFAAGAAFIMAELAALLSITAYLRRFPTVEDMVRVMVPGAERRLLRAGAAAAAAAAAAAGGRGAGGASEYLLRPARSASFRRRPNGPHDLWARDPVGADFYACKAEALVASELEGAEGPLLLTKAAAAAAAVAPDVCAANPGAGGGPTATEAECVLWQVASEAELAGGVLGPAATVASASPPLSASGAGAGPGAHLLDRDVPVTTAASACASPPPPSAAGAVAASALDYDIPLSGVTTVPITLMRQQPLKPQQLHPPLAPQQSPLAHAHQLGHTGLSSAALAAAAAAAVNDPSAPPPTPTPFLFAQQLQQHQQRFGMAGAGAGPGGGGAGAGGGGTLLHQGVLGVVAEGASTSSSSSAGTAASGSGLGPAHPPVKFATLQPARRAKPSVSSFGALEQYDSPRGGPPAVWSSSEV